MTYKDKILNSTGTLTKGENVNGYASTRTNAYDLRPKLKKIDFPNTGLFSDNDNIIMVTIKGN